MSVTKPKGFLAASGSVGIKSAGASDVSIVTTRDGNPVSAAGVFTSNKAASAPVQVSRRHLDATSGRCAGVILTSGNANAATGEHGRSAAEQLCSIVAGELDVAAEEILVCQTGLIGVTFPIEMVAPKISGVVERREAGEDADLAAARAIMTTDTVVKIATVEADGFIVGSIAKGAAMISPDMATMLALVTTDARCSSMTASRVLKKAVASSFNEMTIDGCTSTNDSVLLLASGKSERRKEICEGELSEAVTQVCVSLAAQMASDAEGATKVVKVKLVGAVSCEDAHRGARKVADSLLVKCSLNGEDPYWGRVVSELGSAGIAFDIDSVSVSYGSVTVCRGGVAVEHDRTAVANHMRGREIVITCDLGVGTAAGTAVGTDLGHGYIDLNRTTS